MRQYRFIFITVFCVMQAFFLCRLGQAEEVVLGANPWAPYVQFTDDTAHGVAVEKVEAIFRDFDQSVSISSLPFKRVLKYAEVGNTDGVLLSANRKERQEYLAFSEPIFCERRIFVVRKGEEFDWRNIDELRGKTLGIGAGFYKGSQVEGWEKQGIIPPVTEVNEQVLFNLLDKARLAFILYSEKELFEFQKNKQIDMSKFSILPVPLNELTLHMGFSLKRDGMALKEKVNASIEKLKLREDCGH